MGEINYILQTEFVATTLDVILRRTSIAIEGKLNSQVFDELSELVATHFNWSETEKVADRENAQEVLFNLHGVVLDQPLSHSEAVTRTKIIENEQLVNGEEYVFNQ